MDFRMLLAGAAMSGVGGLIVWRFRNSRFNTDIPAGCAMSGGLLLVLCGLLTLLFGFWFNPR